MLNNLIRWSLVQRWWVVLAAVGLLVWGGLTTLRMPLDVFPNFAPPQVTVQTEAVGLAPDEMERLVTFPIESALNGTPGVQRVYSKSAIGLSVVTVIFDWSTDLYRARQLVTEKVQLAQSRFPQGVRAPVLSPPSSPLGWILKYAFTVKPGGTTTLMDLTTEVNRTVRNRLLAVPGVSNVLVIGGQQKQYQVLVHPDQLKQYGISLAQVVEAAEGANLNAPGGFLQTADREYLIRGVGRIETVDQLARSVITAQNGTPVRLADVATVQIGPALARGDASLNGEAAIVVTIVRQPNADTPTTTRAVEAALEDLRSGFPKDIQITTTFRQDDFIEKSVDNVIEALRDGAIIVAVILFLFLGNWRTIVITLTALPLSVLVAILILNYFGIGLNTMTLGGLAIALGGVIDDAIVDAENVYRRLQENSHAVAPHPALEVIYEGSVQIRSSVVFATLIVCIVIAPIFILSGVEGRIFTPLGWAYIFSTLASLVVALTVTPALCYLLLANQTLREEETWLVRQLKNLYRPLLHWSLANPLVVIISSAAAFFASLLLIPGLGTTFLPEFQERELVVALAQPPGASLASTQRIGLALGANLKKYPEIESAQFRAGRAFGDDEAGGTNFAELDVHIAKDAPDREKVVEDVRTEINKIPGVVANVGGFISHRIDEILSGSRSAIAVKVFGNDLAELRRLAQQVEGAMRPIAGVVDLQVEPLVPVDQITVQFNREAANRYGLTIKSLAQTIETAFSGQVVSQVLEQQRVVDVIVWLAPQARQQTQIMANLLIDTPNGQKIPLSQVAQIRVTQGPNTINRESVSRRIVVSANTRGRDLGSVIADIRREVQERVVLPQGYYIEYGGQFEAQENATRELVVFSGLALVVVALLLYSAVQSVRSTLLMLANLPLALIGGLIAVWLGGGVLSIASLIGFITLFGVANRNALILVTTYNQLIQVGKEFREAIIEGSVERLSPVLMTALTAGLAMVPLAFGPGEGKEILQPLAVVVLGGLFTSTALTLVVLPALFIRFGTQSSAASSEASPLPSSSVPAQE